MSSCPFKKDHSQNMMDMYKSEDGKCPARNCPVLKESVEKKSKSTKSCKCEACDCNPCDCDGGKCPFLKNHNCSYFKNMQDCCKK